MFKGYGVESIKRMNRKELINLGKSNGIVVDPEFTSDEIIRHFISLKNRLSVKRDDKWKSVFGSENIGFCQLCFKKVKNNFSEHGFSINLFHMGEDFDKKNIFITCKSCDKFIGSKGVSYINELKKIKN